MSTIGQRLAEERSRVGMNQTDFAARGGVGRASQVNYETDRRSPDADYLAAISALGVDVQYIVTGERCGLAVMDGAADRARAARSLLAQAMERIDRASALLG
jgi:transcriptional regulator with XRE-family HTH domain